jgi:hypothetical protein
MSRRACFGLFLTLCAGTAVAEPPAGDSQEADRVLSLAVGNWTLYRPAPRAAQIHDLDYMMDRLRAAQPGLALRFSHSPQFRLDLEFAPLSDRSNFIGPVHDMRIGATRLTFSFGF